MPYTLEQLEFLGLHLGVVVPPELLEKKRKAGGSTTETPTPTTPPTPQPTVTPEQTRIIEKRKKLLGDVTKLTDPPFAAKPALAALKLEREAAAGALTDESPTPEQFQTAERAIAAFAQKVEVEKQRVIAEKARLKKAVEDFVEPTTAEDSEKNAIKAELTKAGNALTDEAPTPAQIKIAETSLASARRMVKEAATAGALASKDPKQAKATRKAFKKFADILDGEEPTPEAVEDAGRAVSETNKAGEALFEQYQLLEVVPTGETPEAKGIREAALEEKKKEIVAAREKYEKAMARENALLGQKYLTEALDHGPLSSESGQRLTSGSADIVKAFTKNARLAKSAVQSLASAQHPEVIAKNIGKMVDMVGTGFEAGDGGVMADKHAQAYGEKLLRMGGEVGEEFFDGLSDYISSGRQFEANPLGAAHKDPHVLAQRRGNALAGSMIKPDGSIDLSSDKAKNAIGDLLFNPDVLDNPTPAMTAHVLKTVKFLQDPVTGPKASQVLKDTKEPTNPGAQKLIRQSLGKGNMDALDDNATRTAVLSSMFKPLNQGKVGSCFSTAPCRRLFETQPLDAMKAFSEIATKGTFKPQFGERVPVVTNVPNGEDPLQRSLEYTLATSVARTGDSSEKKALVDNLSQGADQLKGASGCWFWQWNGKKEKLVNDVKAAFTFVYDPESKVTDSSDGSSSTGRYVTMRVSTGKQIRTKEAFIAEMADVAIKSFGLDANSDYAKQVKDVVGSPAFINSVCPGKYKPWELESGGQTEDATKTLLGGTMAQQQILPKAPKDPQPTEGKRTTDVLGSFLNGLGSRPESMVTVRTVGRHGFNALPNHPSLAPLKGNNPTETAQNMDKHLVKKGQALKNTELSAERAAWLFDQELEKAIEDCDAEFKVDLVNGAKTHRPTANMKPAELTAAVKAAMVTYYDKYSLKRANSWKKGEENAGRTVTPEALTKKKTSFETSWVGARENRAKSALIRDMGAPEFVIADTNWGNPGEKTLFVIAPDPTTGDPIMWKKTVPPGSLSPAGRQWVDDQWAHIS